MHRQSLATPADEGAEAVVAAIASACRAVIGGGRRQPGLKLGLCAPGPLDAQRGHGARHAHHPRLHQFSPAPGGRRRAGASRHHRE